jgi:hypothetical protein
MIHPSDFKKLWHVKNDWQQNEAHLIEVNVLLCNVGIRPVSQLAEVADPNVSLEAEDDGAIHGGHQGRVDQWDKPGGNSGQNFVAVSFPKRRQTVGETS